MSRVFQLPNSDIEYLRSMLIRDGKVVVYPYSALAGIPQEHISQLCVQAGLYCLPTLELVHWLEEEIAGRKAIEIGAGNGVLARMLGIPATDSRMQESPEIRQYYEALRQAPVQYGDNVQQYDAHDAVRRFKPEVVVAAWVTHKYDPREHWCGGNMYGVDEAKILAKVQTYIHVGHERVHAAKPLAERPHRAVKAEWLLSRSPDREGNVIWIWEG